MNSWHCGRFQLILGARTYVMAILNATPDSFSADGVLGAAAIDQGWRLMDEGCDILDIGGESTRPGAAPVSAQEEMDRVLPVLEALAAKAQVPLSVDTTKASVAAAALQAGASIINDISGGTFDAEMFPAIAASGCGYVLMHLRGTPSAMDWSRRVGRQEDDLVAEVRGFWDNRLAEARAAGIEPHRVAVDPGFGFGKSVRENLDLLRRGPELALPGCARLIGTSRKSTLGKILGDCPPGQREWASAATAALAVAAGYDIVRVHDVAATTQVVRVADAVMRQS